MTVYNNMIVNNVSTHEGGGISLNDAPNVRVVNNTVMKNLTTATAVTSNGAAGAGRLVHLGQQRAAPGHAAGAGAPTFSKPLMFNNIFWDNRAGTQGRDHRVRPRAGRHGRHRALGRRRRRRHRHARRRPAR